MITTCVLLILGVCLTPELQRTHSRLIRRAITRSVETMQRASQEAEINNAQFMRQVEMIEGSHKRLAMQPVEFWQWYAVEITKAFGLPVELDTAARLERAVRVSEGA